MEKPEDELQNSEAHYYQSGYRAEFSRRAPGANKPKDEHPLAFDEPLDYDSLASSEGGGQRQQQQQVFREQRQFQQQREQARPRHQQAWEQSSQQSNWQQRFQGRGWQGGWNWQGNWWYHHQRARVREKRAFSRLMFVLVGIGLLMLFPGIFGAVFALFGTLLAFGSIFLLLVMLTVIIGIAIVVNRIRSFF